MELINKYFKVLDDGFIALKDYMGSDEDIEQAARVSYGKGTRKVSDTRNLIRYLMRHHHSTPTEMGELKFHIRAPIYVFRQWHRHRTWCISGDTKLYFDSPCGKDGTPFKRYNLSVKEIYNRFQTSHKRNRIKRMKLRQMNEDSGELQHTHINDIIFTGQQQVFEIELENGFKIKATNNHKFSFNDGWFSLNEKLNLEEINGKAVYDNKPVYLHTNGLFVKGQQSWNKDKKYKLHNRIVSDSQKEAIRKARSGKNSNFWKGGISSERANIARWTTQIASKIHLQNNYTCQLCSNVGSKLHCHHIVPVSMDESLAKIESNLTTLCIPCHKLVSKDEIKYIEILSGQPIKKEYHKIINKNYFTIVKCLLTKVKNITYIGIEDTYDISVDGPFHNFIANGIVTHNSYNEYSGRYSEMIDSCEKTSEWRIQSTTNKQGSDGIAQDQQYLTDEEKRIQEDTRKVYEDRLRLGVAKEQARKELPVSNYTEMYAKVDLKNLLHFMSLRADGHAQLEIRLYANIICGIVQELLPLTFEAWYDYQFTASTFTRLDKMLLDVVMRKGLDKNTFNMEIATNMGMSSREIEEFWNKLEVKSDKDIFDLSKYELYDFGSITV